MNKVQNRVRSNRSMMPSLFDKVGRRILQRLAVRGEVQVSGPIRVGWGARISSLHGLEIGRLLAVGPRTVIEVDGKIGDFVMIGRNVQIVGRADHAYDEVGVPMLESTWIGDRPGDSRDRVQIGRDVWIGASSVILSGISIGEGAIVAAGSVVTKDVAPFTIVGGNPIRVIGRRFTDERKEQQHSSILDSR